MNILLLDGGKNFGHSHGELNHTLHKKAKEVLTVLGHNIQETVIDAGYDVEAEIEKFLWMDAVIWQMPGWWMHEPWTVKKYIDEVLTAGHGIHPQEFFDFCFNIIARINHGFLYIVSKCGQNFFRFFVKRMVQLTMRMTKLFSTV